MSTYSSSYAGICRNFFQISSTNEEKKGCCCIFFQAKGYDTRNHILACFGGAGGQHACAISRQLGIKTVFLHKYAGILSAYGMACADVVEECQEPCAKVYNAGK